MVAVLVSITVYNSLNFEVGITLRLEIQLIYVLKGILGVMTEITCTEWHSTCCNTCLLSRVEVNSLVFFCVLYYFLGKGTVTLLFIEGEYYLAELQHDPFHSV